jgi:hypothetical protein
MFTQDRQQLRNFYSQAWQKYQDKLPLDALESQLLEVILLHPEYHELISNPEMTNEQEFHPELGESNPFMHMGLREQLSTNRPQGIKKIHQQLCQTQSLHDTEHQMMEILAEMLWQAQRDNKMPDEQDYLTKLQRLLHA